MAIRMRGLFAIGFFSGATAIWDREACCTSPSDGIE